MAIVFPSKMLIWSIFEKCGDRDTPVVTFVANFFLLLGNAALDHWLLRN